MQLYDRTITLTLIKHDGRGTIQDQLDVTNSIVTLGDKSWAVGGTDLVRISPSTLTFRLFDQTDSIYNWIQTTLAQTDGLVPPFVLLTVDGNAAFYGTVTLDNVKRTQDVKQDFLDFSCQDWSRLLADADMSALIKRPLPRIVSTTGNLRVSKTKAGQSPMKLMLTYFYMVGHPEAITPIYFDLDTDWLIPGDRVYCNETSQTYTVEKVWLGANGTGTANCYTAILTGFTWPNPGGSFLSMDKNQLSYTFIRQASNAAATSFLTAKQTIVPDSSSNATKFYSLQVDSVNGVYPGDVLNHQTAKSTTSYTVRDLDSENNFVIFTDAISTPISIGDKLTLSDESYEYVLFEPFKKLVQQSAATINGGVDFSRFQPHTFTRPFLSWLPFRGPAGDIISAPNNIQAGATNITLRGPDQQVWSGLPETGYTAGSSWVEYADWTHQLTSAPASLMPLSTYSDYALRSNRPRYLLDWKIGDTTTGNNSPSGFYVYDYNSMKRYEIKNTTGGTTFYSDVWSGSAWTTRTTIGTVASTAQAALSAVPFPAVTGALLVLQKDGNLTIRCSASYSGTTIAAPQGLTNAALVSTPYGVYLIGPNGSYGKVSWVSNALHIDYYRPTIQMSSAQTLKEFRFFETTLTAIDVNTLYILGNIRYIKDAVAENPEVLDEVWLFNLDPNAVSAPSIQPEKIADGTYTIARTVKDPSSDRIFGLLGGRLFQISKTITDTFERFKPDSSALELIEHLCIAQNAVALPGDGPMLQIISRNFAEAALPVNLEIKQDITNRTLNFFSTFDVKGSSEDINWYWLPPGSNDAMHELSSIKRGGKNLDLSAGDYVSTISQCASLGADYADFYGKPRMGRELEVIYSGDGPAPYESLKPLQRIRINSESTEWHVLGVTYSLMNSTGKVKLLQAY